MARISVEIKFLEGVEDPEALTIQKNLKLLGYKEIKQVKTSKTYEFEFEDRTERPEEIVKNIAEKILANPVIQSYSIRE